MKEKLEASTYLGGSCKSGPHGEVGCLRYKSNGVCIERHRVWLEDHRNHSREKDWKKHGISFRGQALKWDSWKEIKELSANKCALCGKDEQFSSLAADHDSKTGEVRGALCYECNYKHVAKFE